MLRESFRGLRRFLQEVIGVNELRVRLQRLETLANYSSETVASMTSALASLHLSTEDVAASSLYQRASEIVSLLSPMDVAGVPLKRVGRSDDGGYIMLDQLGPPHVSVAYSFGVGDDISWETHVAEQGTDVRLFDHTVEGLPAEHARIRYRRLGITGTENSPVLQTLPQLIESFGDQARSDMLLKMDVEGCEWDVLCNCPSSTLGQFTQIVLELHNIIPMLSGDSYAVLIQALRNLTATHQSIHVHANVYGPALILPGLVLPSTVECTFVNRKVFGDQLTQCSRSFPTSLDRSCHRRRADLVLGRFAAPPTRREP